MTIRIRTYSHLDKTDDIFDLHDDALRAIGCIPLDRKWNEDLYDIDKNYIESGGEFLIIEVDNQMVGFGALKLIDNGLFEIKRMRVSPKRQGCGLGKLLLSRLLEIARSKGANRIVLDTTVQQIVAQKLYESFGFIKHGQSKFFGFDVILYEKTFYNI